MRALATAALILAAADAGAPPSTFREGRATCRHCDIETLVRKEAGAGATNCGWAKTIADRARLNKCVLAAVAAKQSFFSLTDATSIDANLVIGLVGRGSSLHKLEYQDDVTGGMGLCEGVTIRLSCSGLKLRGEFGQGKGTLPSLLDCRSQRNREAICEECKTKRFELGPEEDASTLRCDADDNFARVPGGVFSRDCERAAAGDKDRPVPAGLRLRCEGHSHGAMDCQSGSATWRPFLQNGCRR